MGTSREVVDANGSTIKSTADVIKQAMESKVAAPVNNTPVLGTAKIIKDALNKKYSPEEVRVPQSTPDITPEYRERVAAGVNESSFHTGYQQDLASAQSGAEVLGKTLNNFGVGIVGGFTSALGSTLDVKGTAEMLAGMDAEYGNMLGDWGRDFMEKNQMKIYEQNPGKSMQVLDSGWWGKIVGQSG